MLDPGKSGIRLPGPAVQGWLIGILVAGVFVALVWSEYCRPLRRTVESKLTHNLRNLVVAVTAAVVLNLTELPVVGLLTDLVERRSWGLLKQISTPLWVEVALAFLLMDYTLYVWHVLTHRVPFLWRFHLPHHIDLDLDASTALRFHFGELALSVPWRVAQVLFIGVSPLSFAVWQTATLLFIMFHHSNVQLPLKIERWVNCLIVTPRMHGIHHSMVPEETNSNWSSGLALWDRLHGTLRLNVPQHQITIGVPAYREPREVSLLKILALPFGKSRPPWRLPGGGEPSRASSLVPSDYLLQ